MVAKETLYVEQMTDSSFHFNMCRVQAEAQGLAEIFNERVVFLAKFCKDVCRDGSLLRNGECALFKDLRESQAGSQQCFPLLSYSSPPLPLISPPATP